MTFSDEREEKMTEKSFPKKRLGIKITGAVQGVGFRPFVWRLAQELRISGWVINGTGGVEIEAEACESDLLEFSRRLADDAPPLAKIENKEYVFLESLVPYHNFGIRGSDDAGEKTVSVLPDMAACPECLCEIFDPTNRRYRYPFTNCTNCGPRYSIIESVPYDRPNTSMKVFQMCPLCEKEYHDPNDRRFYAQPNACPVCGPHLELWNKNKTVLFSHDYALCGTAGLIRFEYIVAVKGLGGFQLFADATKKRPIEKLRERKGRPGKKPFAVMYPDIGLVKAHCEVSEAEEKLLLSSESPIVLLKRKEDPSELEKMPCGEVAPNSNIIGVMLPYTPLHHLLMNDLGFPAVATSGNLSDEPIITDEYEAVEKLKMIADIFLVHNRDIIRHVDDSIARVMGGKTVLLRRARGYAPLPLAVKTKLPNDPCLIAFGSDLKNTGAVLAHGNVFLTQHIGDMETLSSKEALLRSLKDSLAFRDIKPEAAVCDLHPDYSSTRMAEAFASEFRIPLYRVQHHKAHLLSALSENAILGERAFGVAWDGTGYGEDGTIWGGEFFRIGEREIVRCGHFRTFGLIGGDVAAREPKRSAVAMLYEIFGKKIFEDDSLAPVAVLTETERKLFPQILERGINVCRTSSVGRLFDAVASILGICHSSDHEGHAAILLEQAIEKVRTEKYYSLHLIKEGRKYVFNWEPMIREILADQKSGVSSSRISAIFHNTMAGVIECMTDLSGEKNVVLSGGCFQNKYLLERTLRELGTRPYLRVFVQNKIPPNDGGIALGQIASVLQNMTDSR